MDQKLLKGLFSAITLLLILSEVLSTSNEVRAGTGQGR